MELQNGLKLLESFHGEKISAHVAARLKDLMVELAAKRKRGEDDGNDDDEEEGERESGSKRPRVSANRLFYLTLKNASSRDFWLAYFAADEEQQTFADTRILPRRKELTVSTFRQVVALEGALDRFKPTGERRFQVTDFEMIPAYPEIKAMREAEVMILGARPSDGFLRCLKKLLAVSRLVDLTLLWVHLDVDTFNLLLEHTTLRMLALGDGVSAQPNFNVGDWLELMSITELQAPVQFAPTTLLSIRLSEPSLLRQLKRVRPWILKKSGEPRTFPSLRNLVLIELDFHHAAELYPLRDSGLPIDALREHEDLKPYMYQAFPRLMNCDYDVLPRSQDAAVQMPTQQQLEVFPKSCKTAQISLRSAMDIIEQDRRTAFIGTGRRINKLELYDTPFTDVSKVDGLGLTKSFPRVKSLRVPRLDVLSDSLGESSRYFWRTIVELPQWVREGDVGKDEAQVLYGTLIDYEIEKQAYRPRQRIDPAIFKSSRTRKLVISALFQSPYNRFEPTELSLPQNLETLICINDVWFVEKMLLAMSDSTRNSLRNIWFHRMELAKIQEDLSQVAWRLDTFELKGGLPEKVLDRLHPDTLVNGKPLSEIKKRDAMDIV